LDTDEENYWRSIKYCVTQLEEGIIAELKANKKIPKEDARSLAEMTADLKRLEARPKPKRQRNKTCHKTYYLRSSTTSQATNKTNFSIKPTTDSEPSTEQDDPSTQKTKEKPYMSPLSGPGQCCGLESQEIQYKEYELLGEQIR
jgi:hypothetical protein